MGPTPILTDNEGTLLSLILRAQPCTAYQVMKIYEASPISNFNTSKGKIYPLILRLRNLDLLTSEAVEGDARKTERLTCTPAGRAAVKEWVKQIRPSHLVLEDPLRTKMQSFDLLSSREQVEWIIEMKAALLEKLADLEKYAQEVDVPYLEIVHDNAVSSLRARMDWLDRTLIKTVREQNET